MYENETIWYKDRWELWNIIFMRIDIYCTSHLTFYLYSLTNDCLHHHWNPSCTLEFKHKMKSWFFEHLIVLYEGIKFYDCNFFNVSSEIGPHVL